MNSVIPSAAGWITLLSCLLLADGASPEDKNVSLSETGGTRVRSLVRQLGDERFAVREQASAELLQIGLPALQALQDGSRDSDREIRYRCRRLLNLVSQMDFERRLEGFAAGRSGGEYDLPGWTKFRQMFGDSKESRAVFVAMQEAEPSLMQAIEVGPIGVGAAIELRCIEIQQTQGLVRKQVELGSVAAMLFGVVDERVNVPLQTGTALASLCYQPVLGNAIQDSSQGPILKKLLGAWVKRGSGWTAYQGMTLAMRYDLKEGLVPALNVVKNPGNQAYIRQNGILAIAKLGDESHEAVLKELLDDQTQCSSQKIEGKSFVTQIRDVALAALLILRKEDPREFGFSRIVLHPTNVFIANTVGFENEDARKAVFDKWYKLEEAREESN